MIDFVLCGTEGQETSNDSMSVVSVNGKKGFVELDADDVGAIADAPQDGKQYARKNGFWEEVQGGSGGTAHHNELDNRNLADQHPISAISGLQAVLSGMDSAIDGINDLIPDQATEENQLADKNFVNSSIATNTAYFRGTFDSVEELEAYSGTKTVNDYAFVVEYDEITEQPLAYNRYKWDGDEWLFEYVLNNSSFTAEQWEAINSGITSGDVELIKSALQQSDLNDYRTASEQDIIDATKISKPTVTNPSVVTIDANGDSQGVQYSNTAISNAIVQRNGTQIKTDLTPVADADCTSKKYVDDLFASIVDGNEVAY